MAAYRTSLAIATGRSAAPVAGLRARSFAGSSSIAALSLYLPIGCRA